MQFGLIGKSLIHSFSKDYFERKFQQLSLSNFSYQNFELNDIQEIKLLWKRYPDLKGVNVTIPYKKEVLPFLDEISSEAEKIGAVNVVTKMPNGKLIGFNSDYYAFLESLKPLLQNHHKKALILGTGGASDAVDFALEKLGVLYKKVSRNPNENQWNYETASDNLDDYFLIINTTPLGTFPNINEVPPLSLKNVNARYLFYDLIYNPEETTFLRQAKENGATIKNGLEMLQLQAEKSWDIWQNDTFATKEKSAMENRNEEKAETEIRDDKIQTSKNEDTTLEGEVQIEEHDAEETDTQVKSEEEIPSSEPEFKEPEPKKSEEKAAKDSDEELETAALLDEKNKKADVAEASIVGNPEELSDEELEADDETEDVHSDEDEEADEHEPATPDYAELSPAALVKEAEQLIQDEPVEKLRDRVEAIRKNLLRQLNEERKEKLAEFVEGGGAEMDFRYEQPLREKFRQLFGVYRHQRKKHFDEKRKVLDDNLLKKQGLIESIKEILTKEESIGKTFKEFNAIQEEWRATGPVPRTESGDLWRTYHHHVDNFYEFIKINKELRDLDYRKNREQKEELIGKAEALDERDYGRAVFEALNKLHKEWKRIGPVEREFREPLWERFQLATKKLHKKRDAHFEKLREQGDEQIERKKALLKDMEAFVNERHDSHSQWQKAMQKLNDFQDNFRKIGRAHHPENDALWEQFREFNKTFRTAKNNFYKNRKQEFQENIDRKNELLAQAEELKDSEDWDYAANELKYLQAEWKRTGFVPRSQEEKIWKKFRSACNYFFDRLSNKNKEKDKVFENNLDVKKGVLEELKNFSIEKDQQKETIKGLKKIIGQWKSIGPVPRGKNKIESEFNKVLDAKFNAIDLDRAESQRIRYENKMESLSQGGSSDLKRERQTMRKTLEEAENELRQSETNLSFFSGNPKSPLLKDAQQKIDRQKENIEGLQQKIKMLNVKIREMERPKAEDGESD